MNIKIEKLNHRDIDKFIELIGVFEAVFEMVNFVSPDREHLEKLIGRPDFIVFIATANKKIVGGLTSYILEQYYSTKPIVYLYDLAVESDFQRQGIGKLLVSNLTNYCKEKGFEEVFVQADKVDDKALDFYRSTKAIEEQVVHFTYPLTNS